VPELAPEASAVSSMPRIAMVLHLEGVVPFKFCSAEEIVRLASIATQVAFAAGEVIYREGDAARALYTIVDGRVSLADVSGSKELGAHQTFGVLEILSGRLRRSTATALGPTRALAFEAEDFFDLLSNNVEIVKALFRQVLNGAREHSAGGLA
jgi:CRP-like cAMP-binding protein